MVGKATEHSVIVDRGASDIQASTARDTFAVRVAHSSYLGAPVLRPRSNQGRHILQNDQPSEFWKAFNR